MKPVVDDAKYTEDRTHIIGALAPHSNSRSKSFT
jgi:hypothetical protein